MNDDPSNPLDYQPPGDEGDPLGLIRVFIAGNEMEAVFVQSLLEAERIVATVQGQMLGMARGGLPLTLDTLPGIWVKRQDVEAANAVLMAYRNRPTGTNRERWRCPRCSEQIEGQFTHCWKCGAERGEAVEPTPAIPLSDNSLDYRSDKLPDETDEPNGVK